VLALCGNALAEYAAIEANDRRAVKIPEGVSYEAATAIGVQALTAITLVNESEEG
jgi:NADPH:quinone reductase-like Zn-dependent oxidoreductase